MQDKLLPHSLPQDRVEEAVCVRDVTISQDRVHWVSRAPNSHVAAALVRRRLLDRLRSGFLGEPESEFLVVPPVVLVAAVGVGRGRSVSKLLALETGAIRETDSSCAAISCIASRGWL